MTGPSKDATTWSRRRWWLMLMGLGWLVYEATAQPWLGAVVACARFGWGDFLTARWLRKMAPEKHRGAALYCFYLAAGLLKTGLGAVLLTGAFVLTGVLFELLQGPIPPNHPGLLGSLLATVIEIAVAGLFAGLCTLLGIAGALRHGIRIWVDSRVHRARRFDAWPPDRFGRNSAYEVLRFGLVLPFAALAMPLAFVALVNGVSWPFVLIPIVLILTTIALFHDWLARRTVASAASHCWPESFPAVAAQNDMR